MIENPAFQLKLADPRGRTQRLALAVNAAGGSERELGTAVQDGDSGARQELPNILAKLNLSSQVEAAVFAVEHKVGPSGREER